MEATEVENLVGRTIAGRYAIESLVGEGAMGSVYRARQISLGTTLALKIMHRHLSGEPTFAARFLREAQAASRIDHPNSMRVLDYGEEPDGLLYIAMEYLDGRTLASIVEKGGPLPLGRAANIASQILAVLGVAHELGVIHRDLKPENIVVLEGTDDEGEPQDIVKVCDFGVAKLLAHRPGGRSVTGDGIVVGTPQYMSPEQARGDALDARSDLYAMGVLLFHMMTGKVPFEASTALGTALLHVTEEPMPPSIIHAGVDPRLEAICMRAMSKRPEDRFMNAREMRSSLRPLFDRRAGTEDSSGMHPRSALDDGSLRPTALREQLELPRRGYGIFAALGVLALVVATAFVFGRRSASEHTTAPVVIPPTAVPAVSMAPAAHAAAPPPEAAPAAPPEAEPAPATHAAPSKPAATPHVTATGNAQRAAGTRKTNARKGAPSKTRPAPATSAAKKEAPGAPSPPPSSKRGTKAGAKPGKADGEGTAEAPLPDFPQPPPDPASKTAPSTPAGPPSTSARPRDESSAPQSEAPTLNPLPKTPPPALPSAPQAPESSPNE
jgi:eukaryotic-like serine/threonine-protein kinase